MANKTLKPKRGVRISMSAKRDHDAEIIKIASEFVPSVGHICISRNGSGPSEFYFRNDGSPSIWKAPVEADLNKAGYREGACICTGAVRVREITKTMLDKNPSDLKLSMIVTEPQSKPKASTAPKGSPAKTPAKSSRTDKTNGVAEFLRPIIKALKKAKTTRDLTALAVKAGWKSPPSTNYLDSPSRLVYVALYTMSKAKTPTVETAGRGVWKKVA